jgi:hypothetical protein
MWYGEGEKTISRLWYKATLFCRGPALGPIGAPNALEGPDLQAPRPVPRQVTNALRNGASHYN